MSTTQNIPWQEVFPYLAYRWKYDDGEYSPFSFFTETQFVPQDLDEDKMYTEGYNTSMENTMTSLSLSNISKGGPDVVMIQILYTESLSSTIYIIESHEIPAEERGVGLLNVLLTKRSFFKALPDEQLNRHFDNVPRKAKTQEITANRLVYGNYLQNFDQPTSLQMTLGTTSVALPTNGPSVKTNRSYEIGVVFRDKYGRWGNIIAGRGDGITTPFDARNRLALTAQITDPWPNELFESYVYFVKDISGEHRNIVSHYVYNDGSVTDNESEFIWLGVNSSERNKIEEGDFLIPRRHTLDPYGTSTGTVFETLSKHPIVEIANEAPANVSTAIGGSGRDTRIVDRMDGGEYNLNINKDPVTLEIGSQTVNLAGNSHNNGPSTEFNNILNHLLQFFSERGISSPYDGSNSQVWDIRQNPPVEISRTDLMAQATQPLASGVEPESDILLFRVSSNDTGKRAARIIGVDFAEVDQGANGKFPLITLVLGLNYLAETGDPDPFNEIGLNNRLIDNANSADEAYTVELYESTVSDIGFETQVSGKFFVKIPRTVDGNTIISGQTEIDENGNASVLRSLYLETQPSADSIVDFYWASSKVFTREDYGAVNTIPWSNCIAFVDNDGTSNGVFLECTRIYDKFNSVQINKGVQVSTPLDNYAQDRRSTGLIWSGLFNSITGINDLNQFIQVNNIVKELEPNYGSLQLLYTRDTDVIAFCESKVFKILADKDVLYNASGGGNVSATSQVLGQVTPFQGEYGIGKSPESFAFHGHNIFFMDPYNGSPIQLTPINGQMFEISKRGMYDFFRDRIPIAISHIGMYDSYSDTYVVSIQGYDHTSNRIGVDQFLNEDGNATIAYSTDNEGWTSRMSFVPERGISLNNTFYTFYNGSLWVHNSSNVPRNNFYGTQYKSFIKGVDNNSVELNKNFNAMSIDGSNDWKLTGFDTDQDAAVLSDNFWFKDVEGKRQMPLVKKVPLATGVINNADGTFDMQYSSTEHEDQAGKVGHYAIMSFESESTESNELFSINNTITLTSR